MKKRAEEDPTYLETRCKSYEAILRDGLVDEQMLAEFKELEEAMNRGGLIGDDFLSSYQRSDDVYKRHLKKILEALVTVGEPHSSEKLEAVVEELATMGPAVFLTPWEITLKYLDTYYGNFEDVIDFYS